MSGITFGKEVKIRRNKKGISSKILSTRVGKAVTYVSQLERGLIKNPDYSTCKNILKELGINETESVEILSYFSIYSPEQEKAEMESLLSRYEDEEWEHTSGYYAKKMEKVFNENEKFVILLKERIDDLIMHDNSRASLVLNNLINITKDETIFDSFFCRLMENNFTILNEQERSSLVSTCYSKVLEKHNELFINSTLEEEEEQ